MSSIHFFKEDVTLRLPPLLKTRRWILRIINKESSTLEQLNFIFCSDNYLHQINVDFLNHDNYTDIITFDNSEEPRKINGDIFISIERVRENAILLGEPFSQELRRVMIHGVLHLLGYSDKGRKRQQEMRNMENAALLLYRK